MDYLKRKSPDEEEWREEIETITAAVAPGGHLMLAGTTEKDSAAVSALYEARGFERIADEGDGEWHSGLYRKNEGGPV